MIKDLYYLLKLRLDPKGTYVHKISMHTLTAYQLRGLKVYVVDDIGGHWISVGLLGSRYLRVSSSTSLQMEVRQEV